MGLVAGFVVQITLHPSSQGDCRPSMLCLYRGRPRPTGADSASLLTMVAQSLEELLRNKSFVRQGSGKLHRDWPDLLPTRVRGRSERLAQDRWRGAGGGRSPSTPATRKLRVSAVGLLGCHHQPNRALAPSCGARRTLISHRRKCFNGRKLVIPASERAGEIRLVRSIRIQTALCRSSRIRNRRWLRHSARS